MELVGKWLQRETDGCSGNFTVLFFTAETKTCTTLGQGTPGGSHHDVNPGADEEKGARQEHEERRNGQSPSPALVRLHVHNDRQGNHHRESESEVVPVEEAADSPLPGFRIGVELVCSEG